MKILKVLLPCFAFLCFFWAHAGRCGAKGVIVRHGTEREKPGEAGRSNQKCGGVVGGRGGTEQDIVTEVVLFLQ